jgi:tRNA A37 threonylcarbamoyladenosine dehydratase
LTEKITELESTIETVTKKISNIRIEIENITEFISTTTRNRDVLEEHIENVKKEESSHIQDMIDELSTKITTSTIELIKKNKEREELITEETSTRTELTFTSQSLKKKETYKEHLEEQIIVT